MSPKIRRLSGTELVVIFKAFGFETYSQKGSHMKLRRLYKSEKQTLTVPVHLELDTGTIRAIYRQATRYITEDELHTYFYSD